jgi:hypothetical protein
MRDRLLKGLDNNQLDYCKAFGDDDINHLRQHLVFLSQQYGQEMRAGFIEILGLLRAYGHDSQSRLEGMKKDNSRQAALLKAKKQALRMLTADLVERRNSRAWEIALYFRHPRILLARFLYFLYCILFNSRKSILERAQHSAKDATLIRSSGLFDESWYLAQNQDVARSGGHPVLHYLAFGGWEGRKPHPLFDSAFYLRSNPDVAASGMNPLVHYLLHGWREERDPHLLFDTSYYLVNNPDVSTEGWNPLAHYLFHGSQEGRDPHPSFSTALYLSNNPDVVVSGMNPLVHYLLHGRVEGRGPSSRFNRASYLGINPGIKSERNESTLWNEPELLS